MTKNFYKNYVQKAEEMLDVARYAASKSENNAAVIASVHCAINSIDALAVFYLGKRHSGSHEMAINAARSIMNDAEYREFSKQFSGLISLKNQAEYQPDLMTPLQAREAVARASRILSKVKQKLPER